MRGLPGDGLLVDGRLVPVYAGPCSLGGFWAWALGSMGVMAYGGVRLTGVRHAGVDVSRSCSPWGLSGHGGLVRWG